MSEEENVDSSEGSEECSEDVVENIIELGFVERDFDVSIRDNHFTSKIGGRPIFLNPDKLIDLEDLKCTNCNNYMTLLMQIYAPSSDNEDAYHRVLYLFSCKNPTCFNSKAPKCMKLFRCQLPQINEYYEKDDTEGKLISQHPENICFICGIPANKKCSKCKKIFYCTKEHQLFHWHLYHQKECTQDLPILIDPLDDRLQKILFKEMEIVTEPEEYEGTDGEEVFNDEEDLEYDKHIEREKKIQ
eukprot:TRINITY_DN10921_c0_g1_i1.p1 TRINITY_DN10921_c0_g1~~TRINITY_DN10921_c0_g1_i1.p1  ORF type:complete len:259 (+),score=46.55 TRINITY_DN10921_c0_g1_i1:48-779(+)